jgi:plasmid replication initiation protein
VRLGINKDQYKLYADFKRTILESTQKELAERADLTIEFNEIKYGRRVGAINFRIFSKDPLESLPDNEQINPSPTFPIIDAEI